MSKEVKNEAAEMTSVRKSPTEECKKYKKIKYEIDMQNYKINKLKNELEVKIDKNFPHHVIENLNKEIENESCKLDKMVEIAMKKQAENKDEACIWGSISLNDKTFTKPPKTPSDVSNISGIAEMLLSENEALENDRYDLQEEILFKDESICNLHSKIQNLQREICNLTQANRDMSCQLSESKSHDDDSKELKRQIDHFTTLAESMTNVIQNAQAQLKEVRTEFNCLKRDKEMLEGIQGPKCPEKCHANESQNDNVDFLKEQYENLLIEYCKKDKEYQAVTKRLKKCVNNNESDLEKAENEALRKESEKLISEIEDYRILIKELQTQIDLYRDKFMKAQEKVETQKLRIEKLEISKSSIENQVNEEIVRIKEKFQEKLNELCPYPEKYAESRKELENAKTRIQILENNLKDITNELLKAKCELKNIKEQPNDSFTEKFEKMQIQLEEQQKKYCSLKKTKECLEEKLFSMKEELETLRRDSAKILTATKCTADKNRQILHEQINCLEFELAQCRATSTISLTEKEELIKQLKQELNTLCGHFNGCQGQIKQLKDQIEYLTQQRYKSSDKNIDCYELFSNK